MSVTPYFLGAGEFEQASPDDLPVIDIHHRWLPTPFIRDARSRFRIKGNSEAVWADGKILCVVPLFLTFFWRLRGEWVCVLGWKGGRRQLFGYSWRMLRLRKYNWPSYPFTPIARHATIRLGRSGAWVADRWQLR